MPSKSLGLQVRSARSFATAGGGDEGVEGAGGGPPPRTSQRRRHPSVGACGGGVERKWLERSFGLLQPGLAGGSFGFVIGHQGPGGQLGKRDARDHRPGRQVVGVETIDEDQRVGVEHTDDRRRHSDQSTTASTSARNRTGSTAGRRRNCSITSPPWFRNSRIDASAMEAERVRGDTAEHGAAIHWKPSVLTGRKVPAFDVSWSKVGGHSVTAGPRARGTRWRAKDSHQWRRGPGWVRGPVAPVGGGDRQGGVGSQLGVPARHVQAVVVA